MCYDAYVRLLRKLLPVFGLASLGLYLAIMFFRVKFYHDCCHLCLKIKVPASSPDHRGARDGCAHPIPHVYLMYCMWSGDSMIIWLMVMATIISYAQA